MLRCFLETGRVFDNFETRVCYALITPCEDLLEVPAAMHGVEVGVRLGVAFHPIKGDDPYVSDTHNLLAEHLDTVIYMLSEQPGILFARSMLTGVRQTVELMDDLQLSCDGSIFDKGGKGWS